MDGSPSSLRAVRLLTVMMTLLTVSVSEGQPVPPPITPSVLPSCPSPCSGGPTVVIPSGSSSYIIGGTRNGANLFHSFSEFSVAQGNTAAFQNQPPTTQVVPDTTVSNIIGRVTGANPSNIYGTVNTQTGFPSSSLFLINPRGIVIGPGASFVVGGSLHLSTADYLRLGSVNDRFYADLGKTSQLTSAPVTAFGFLVLNPRSMGSMMVKGSTLTVPHGQTLSLIGGNRAFSDPDKPTTNLPSGVTITGGSLTASGGQINVASVASAAEVLVNPTGQLPGLKVVSLPKPGEAPVELQGTPAEGTVFIRGGALVGTVTLGNNVVLKADALLGGKAGNIDIQAKTLNMGTEGLISASTTEAAKEPNTSIINASSRINLSGVILKPSTSSGTLKITTSGLIALTDGANVSTTGNPAGAISINGGKLLLDNSAIEARTTGEKDGATPGIAINVSDDILFNNSASPGSVVVSTGLATDSENELNGGKAGNISITAASFSMKPGTYISARTQGVGEGGDITINVNQLSSEGLITTKSLSPGIKAGSAGQILIQGQNGAGSFVENVNLNSSQIRASAGNGEGGNVEIKATALNVTNGSEITAEATGANKAGNIILRSNDNILIRNSTVSTTNQGESGGNITATAPNMVRLVRANFTSSVEGGEVSDAGNISINSALPHMVIVQDNSLISADANKGHGGNIRVDPEYLIVQGNSRILARAIEGFGGRIDISALKAVLIEPGSELNASAGPAGVSGTINIQAPIQQLSGAIAPLPQAFAVATTLYGQRCATQKGGQFSSFVQGARDGVPPQPGDLIPSPFQFGSENLISSHGPEHGTGNFDTASRGAGGIVNVTNTHMKSTYSGLTYANLTSIYQIHGNCSQRLSLLR